MQLIGFRDSCVISRFNGKKDEYENLERDTIYTGECLYEEAGTGFSRSIITKSPTIFLPEVEAMIKINDAVTVTTEFGRVITSIVRNVRDVNLPWRAGIKVTKIELKQAQGD